MRFGFFNFEISWEKVCEFNELIVNNIVYNFVGNGGVVGVNDKIFFGKWGLSGNSRKRRGDIIFNFY